ncbi:MAG: HEAT repeat domain-containing protein [Planctomycetes bacterium]|nr:HEAT repeat domain-containing protein [Planctomycetota bacterium]
MPRPLRTLRMPCRSSLRALPAFPAFLAFSALLAFPALLALRAPAGAQEKPGAPDLLKRWREAPGEAEAILVEALTAPRKARAELVRRAGHRLSAAAVRGAIQRLQALGDAGADRWCLEIVHHLAEGHDVRLAAPAESRALFRPAAPARLLDALSPARAGEDADLLATLLGLLPVWPKTPELSSRLWRLASRASLRSDLRLLAVRALRGDGGKDCQAKALRQYLTEEDTRVRAALLDLLDPAASPKALATIAKRRESLGRQGTEEVRAFLALAARAKSDEGLAALRDGAIYSREAAERALAVRLLARYADHPRFLDAVREVRDLQVNEPDLRRQMRSALLELPAGSADPRALELIEEAMADPDPGIRLAAVHALRRFPGDRTTPLFARLLEDKVPQVVSGAVWGLFFTRRGEALDEILDHLEPLSVAGGVLLADAMRALSLATGREHEDPGEWLAWRKEQGRLPESYALPVRASRGRTVVRGFYEHTILSHHPLFVLDVSGSMSAWEGFFTRREALYAELSAALGSLDETVAFSLIAFDDDVHPWPEGPRPATAESVASALAFLRSLPDGRGTSFHAPLKAALLTVSCDTVYFLSDGEPSSGELRSPEEIARWLREANARRGLIIHTIGIGETNDLLRRLAVENHGVYKPMLPRAGGGE